MMFTIPRPLLTDSYKTTHPFIYPDAQKMVAYSEFRRSYEKDPVDSRIVLYGVRYIIENYVAVPWTLEEVERAAEFFKTHCASLKPADPKSHEFPFPKDLFLDVVKNNGGYFPVKIEALPEGSVIYPHTPVFQITAEGKYSRLVTYLETVLTMIWYPSTVATLSRRCKDLIEDAFVATMDEELYFMLDSKLHDFGFRGCTTVEQSVIGGCSHLLNFDGSDTLSSAYYAQYHLNDGKPVATSIPATEHSVMTAFRSERLAMQKLLDLYGNGICACVMDSYDYMNALDVVLPSVATHKTEKGGFLVLRPDSGDPVEVILCALRAAEKVFGATTNKKGFKMINGCGVIQGDGIGYATIGHILEAAKKEGFAAGNISFGMGAGLLQKVNRDTMSYATKLSHITYADGMKRDVMKMPKTDASKRSLPGEFVVWKDPETFLPHVYPAEDAKVKNSMVTVYDRRPGVASSTWKWESFGQVRFRLSSEWRATKAFKLHNPITQSLVEKMKRCEIAQENWNIQDGELCKKR